MCVNLRVPVGWDGVRSTCLGGRSEVPRHTRVNSAPVNVDSSMAGLVSSMCNRDTSASCKTNVSTTTASVGVRSGHIKKSNLQPTKEISDFPSRKSDVAGWGGGGGG